ncbi:MAG: hypothetical protein Q8P67_13275 [archaeon]|nr:hypothetical protein [archaeon]
MWAVTHGRPNLSQHRVIRSAISPRLLMNSLRNGLISCFDDDIAPLCANEKCPNGSGNGCAMAIRGRPRQQPAQERQDRGGSGG